MIKKIFSSTIILLIISIVILLIGIYLFWNRNISNVTIKPTRLNITEITNNNQFKVIQYGIDYFFNTGDHVELVPFTVQAGFNLDNMSIKETKLNNGKIKYTITLPKPEILNIDKSEDGGLIINSNNEDNSELIQAFKEYGEKIYVKDIALKENILKKANDAAVEYFKQYGIKLGIDINVLTTAYDNLTANTMFTSRLTPLTIAKISEEYEYINFDNKLSKDLYWIYNKNNEYKQILIYQAPFHYTREHEMKRTSFISVLNPDIKFINNKKLENYISFKSIIKGKTYIIGVVAEDRNELHKYLPFALQQISNTNIGQYNEPNLPKDIYNHTLEEWDNASVEELREYLYYYFIGMYDLHNDFQHKGIPIYMTEKESKNINNKIKDDILLEYEKKYNNTDDIIAVLYESFNRIAFFKKSSVVFFNYELFTKNIYFEVNYTDFNDSSFVTDEKAFFNNDKTKFCFSGNRYCFDTGVLSRVFFELMDKGFISLYLKNK